MEQDGIHEAPSALHLARTGVPVSYLYSRLARAELGQNSDPRDRLNRLAYSTLREMESHGDRDLVSPGFDAALESVLGALAPNAKVNMATWATGTTIGNWKVPHGFVRGTVSIRRKRDSHWILKPSKAVMPFAVPSYSGNFEGDMTPMDLIDERLFTNSDRPYDFQYGYRFYENPESWWGVSIPFASVLDALDTFRANDRWHVRLAGNEFRDHALRIGLAEYPRTVAARGMDRDTVVLCAHLDHPGQINDGPSGVVAALTAAAMFAEKNPNRTINVTVAIVPETLGSQALVEYLREHLDGGLKRVRGAVVLECVGNRGGLVMQMPHPLHDEAGDMVPFLVQDTVESHEDTGPLGIASYRTAVMGDEQAFESVGIPATTLTRFPFPEYHTSADRFEAISPRRLWETISITMELLERMNADRGYVPGWDGNLMLKDAGLLPDKKAEGMLAGNRMAEEVCLRMNRGQPLWLIAEQLGMQFWNVYQIASLLEERGLLKWEERA